MAWRPYIMGDGGVRESSGSAGTRHVSGGSCIDDWVDDWVSVYCVYCVCEWSRIAVVGV